MKAVLKIGDKASSQLTANPSISDGARFGGHFIVEHVRNGKVIHTQRANNLLTTEGLTHILDVLLANGDQEDAWYCILFSTDSTPAEGWLYTIPVCTEVAVKIDEATRPVYVDIHASTTSTNAASKAEFTFNDDLIIYGAGLVGYPGADGGGLGATKGDVSGGGVFLCAARFASNRHVVDDDIINLTYVLSAGDDGE